MESKVKKILLLITLIFASILIAEENKSLAAETRVGDYTYTYELVNGNAENVYISKYHGSGATEDGKFPAYITLNLNIPDTLDGHTVVSVGDGVHNIFNDLMLNCIYVDPVVDNKVNKYTINEFTVPSGLKEINDYAFAGLQFEEREVNFPNGLTTIGNWAFANSHHHTANGTLTIPNSVTEIGGYAFANTFFAFDPDYSYSRKDTQEQRMDSFNPKYWILPPCGFYNLVLGTGLTKIGDYAFINQKYVTSVNIPSNVNSIGKSAFIGCSNLETVTFSNRSTQLNIGDYAFATTKINNVDIKNTYVLGKGVYSNCKELQTATFEDGLTEVPEATFYGCDSLSNVTKTNSITKIGDVAFAACTSLTNSEYHDIVNNITEMGDSAFAGCTGITGNIEVYDIVTTMGTGVFSDCSNIEKANIRAALTEIPNSTFANCTSLNDVTKLNSVTRIGEYAFYNCTSINTEEYNDIRANITEIGKYAFAKCTGLIGNIEVADIVDNLGIYVFADCSNIETANLIHDYTIIPEGTFYRCTNLENVTKKNSVTEIGKNAFYECTSLEMEEYNDISNNITVYGDSSFQGCTGLDGTLNIRNYVTKVGGAAFRDCTNIDNIVFEENAGAQTFGGGCFYGAAPTQELYRIHANGGTRVNGRMFTRAKEVFFDDTYYDVSRDYKWFGDSGDNIITHYKDCTHYIDITCTLPGISLVNPDTNEKLTSINVPCESDFKFKLVIDSEYADRYENLAIKVISEGKYAESDLVEESLEIENGRTYTFENVTRNKQIKVLAKDTGTDLVLREFISAINGISSFETRIPNVQVNRSGIETIDYRHTKYPLAVEIGDKITYTIRVYNEGAVEGEANEIKVRLQDGISFASTSSINDTYGWSVSEDGRTITSNYLESRRIPAYTSGRPKYEELQFECIINGRERPLEQYLVTIAEISSGNDIDSLEDSIGLIEIEDYQKEASYLSSRDTYLKGEEDDTDFEAIAIGARLATGYRLIVNKIDSLSSELLNGAKIELLDEDKNVIDTKITQNGTVDFGSITTYGEGVDKYYLREVETPVGYEKTIDGFIELDVVKTIENGSLKIEIVYDATSIEENDDYNEDAETIEYIPIKTKEQFLKIGSGEQVNVDGINYTFDSVANYQLQNDISFDGTTSVTPISYMEGVLDGNNHTISNVNISETTAPNGEYGYRTGLFRVFSGNIINLKISNFSISGLNYEEEQAVNSSVGGLVGYMIEGKIKNCSGTNIAVSSANQNVGGFVGEASNGMVVFDNCTMDTAKIQGDYNVGAFIGTSKGEVQILNSTNKATSDDGFINAERFNVGGFVGCADKRITAKYANNQVSFGNDEIHDIGGVVGHIGTNGFAVIENCSNTGDIVGANNVGGIVGYSGSVINLIDCSNTGAITAGRTEYTSGYIGGYNAGGIIGKSNPVGSGVQNAIVQLSEDGHTINMYVKNKKVKAFYDFNIVKADLSKAVGDQTLTGAKFNVYDSEGNLIGDENREVDENGSISIKGIQVNSLTPDIYYVKETEAPAGYKILVQDLIKIVVNKTWDAANEKYVIATSADVIPNLDNLEEVEEIPNTAGTGNIASNEIYPNVRYKSSKTGILRCSNSGNIQAKSDGGGIAGCIRGYSSVEECENTSETVKGSSYIAGGIVAEFMQVSMKDEVTVRSCANSAEVNGSSASGGIVGVTSEITQIIDCENNGQIESGYSGGGILGRSIGIVSIDGCSNSRNVNARTGGGIVGDSCVYNCYVEIDGSFRELEYEDDYLTISNCSVTNRAITGEKCGGILGAAGCVRTSISDCNVAITGITASGVGGVIGVLEGKDTYIENCKVIGLHASGNEIAGIIGATYWQSPRSGGWRYYQERTTEIKDCDVLGTKMTASNWCSGIMGSFYPDDRELTVISIQNCNVGDNVNAENEDDVETIISSGIDSATGILCGMYASSAKNIRVSIEDCDVKAKLTVSGNESNSSAAGIMGNMYTYACKFDLDIKNCNVHDSYVTNSSVGRYGNASGVWCGCMFSYYVNANIENCDVTNTYISSGKNNAAGICSYMYESNDGYMLNIKYCDVTNCIIWTSEPKEWYGASSGVGGIVGFLYQSNANMENCNVRGCILYNGHSIGGLLGGIYSSHSENKLKFKNCKIEGITNTDGTIKKTYFSAKNQVTECIGGAIGLAYFSGDFDMDNVDCSDIMITEQESDETGYDSLNAGGLIGFYGYGPKKTFKNIDVNNIEINAKANHARYERTYQTCLGGLFGIVLEGDNSYEHITAKNITINANGAFAGGLIGNVSSGSAISNMNDISVEKCNITVEDSDAVGGLVGLFLGSKTNMENIELKDIDLKLTAANSNKADNWFSSGIGGLCGYCRASELNVNNVNADGVDITGNTLSGGQHQRIQTAGLISILNSSPSNTLFKDCNVKNVNIENVDAPLSAAGGIVAVSVSISDSIQIKDSQVENFKVNTNYLAGGILGVGTAKIDNCTVKNPKMNVHIPTSMLIKQHQSDVARAVAGGAVGVAVQGSELSNITVTADKPEQGQEQQYGLFSEMMAGGIVGIDSGSLRDSNVSNIIVKTMLPHLDQREPSGDEQADPHAATGNGNDNVDEIQVMSYENYVNCAATDVQVLYGE